MTALPAEQGIIDKILDALVALLTLKLQTDISATDASRLQTIKVGPRQDDPAAVVVLLHENDPSEAMLWPHFPLRYPEMTRNAELVQQRTMFGGEKTSWQLRHTPGYELVGGGSRIARAFTAEIEIWGDEIEGLTLERRDVGQLASVVENRLIQTLKKAGPKIGQATPITDSFGESIQMGPFFGDFWTDQEEGEALIVRKYVRFYYACTQTWDTSEW